MLLSKAPLGGEASSSWAQGGMAASLGGDDSPALHLADTLAAGDGLCDEEAAARIIAAAPAAIEALARFGVRFDRDATGGFRLGLEAAHSRNRIVHADGDGSGREIMRGLVEAVRRTPSIAIARACRGAADRPRWRGAVAGLVIAGAGGAAVLATGAVVLATGGIGGLCEESTNPAGCFGQGLALAARAGAVLADLEFVQFHPTAFASAARPMKLISEAVRGEGAALIDESGRRFLAGVPGAELAPRDVVARAVWRDSPPATACSSMRAGIRAPHSAQRFPAIAAICREAGLDPALRSDPGAPGRALSHGRHRGRRGEAELRRRPLRRGRGRLDRPARRQPARQQLADRGGRRRGRGCGEPGRPHDGPSAAAAARRRAASGLIRPRCAPILSRHVGVLRDGDGLGRAVGDAAAARARPRRRRRSGAGRPDDRRRRLRRDARAAAPHCRTDFPEQRRRSRLRSRLTGRGGDRRRRARIAETALPAARSA